MSDQMNLHIKNLITNFENNLFSQNFADEATIWAYIDMDSFIIA